MTTLADVIHFPERQCFSMSLGEETAVLEYRLSRSEQTQATTINFTSTWVPHAFRGQGIAEKLVRTGLQWAKAEGFEITASCWYVAKFLRA